MDSFTPPGACEPVIPGILGILKLDQYTPDLAVREVVKFLTAMLEAGELRRLPNETKARIRLVTMVLDAIADRVPVVHTRAPRGMFGRFCDAATRMMK